MPAMRRRHHIRHKTGNDSAILQADPIEDGGLPPDQSIFETTKEAQEHATDRRCDGAVRINADAAGCDWGGACMPAVEARPDWRLRDRNEQSSTSGLIVPKRAVF